MKTCGSHWIIKNYLGVKAQASEERKQHGNVIKKKKIEGRHYVEMKHSESYSTRHTESEEQPLAIADDKRYGRGSMCC